MFTKKTVFEQYCVVAFPLAFSSDSGCTEHTSGLIYCNEQAYLDSQELFACIANACLLCLYHVDVAHNSQIGKEMKDAHREKARNFSLKGHSSKVQKYQLC